MRHLCLHLLLAAMTAAPVLADGPLPAPQGEVLLTISGRISNTNTAPGLRPEARFDRAMLQQLGWSEVTTTTPWYPKAVRFEGVPLRAVLDAAGADGTVLLATAHNDYAVDMPMADARHYNVILAMKADGEILTLRDKGPLFIIYPFDSDRALQTDSFYIRAVWQLRGLDVR